jgi:hypothetical protein
VTSVPPRAELEAQLASIDAALLDADAQLSMDLGEHHEHTTARLWRGQVLIDWEPDPRAGDCLLRPDLLRRLIALQACIDSSDRELRISAPGRIIAALSGEHTQLVARLGGARRVEVEAILRFADDEYRGGQETYYMVSHGQSAPLLRLRAEVQLRRTRTELPHTWLAPT